MYLAGLYSRSLFSITLGLSLWNLLRKKGEMEYLTGYLTEGFLSISNILPPVFFSWFYAGGMGSDNGSDGMFI